MDLLQFIPLVSFTLIHAVLMALPIYWILQKARMPQWLGLIALFPFGGGVLVIWILALSKWGAGAEAIAKEY
jgi:hypothetical protein